MGSRNNTQGDLGKTVESLLSRVVLESGILFVMGKGPDAVMEGWLDREQARVKLDGNCLSVETKGWHCHLDVGAIANFKFVEEPDVHDTTRQAFSVRFLSQEVDPLLMVFFADMYNSKGKLDPDRVAVFRRLEQQFAGGLEGKK